MVKKYVFALVGLCAIISPDFVNANCIGDCNDILAAAGRQLGHLSSKNGSDIGVFVGPYSSRSNRPITCEEICDYTPRVHTPRVHKK